MRDWKWFAFFAVFYWSSLSFGAPLCSGIFARDFFNDPYADLNHQGRVDNVFFLHKDFLFKPKWTLAPKHYLGQKIELMPLSAIRFMQNRASNNHVGSAFTVVQNARQIRDGVLRAEELPPIRVWQDSANRIWTLDHRRLAAMILSGKVEQVPVVWATPEQVRQESSKMTTLDRGETLLLTVPQGPTLVVERPSRWGEQTLSEAGLREILSKLPDVPRKEDLLEKLSGLSFIDLLPQKNWPVVIPKYAPSSLSTRAVRVDAAVASLPVTDILYSRHSLKDAGLLAAARNHGNIPPLRVWKDASGRIWTADSASLARWRLGGYRGEVPVRWMDPPEASRFVVDSQVAGKSILLELSSYRIGLIIP